METIVAVPSSDTAPRNLRDAERRNRRCVANL